MYVEHGRERIADPRRNLRSIRALLVAGMVLAGAAVSGRVDAKGNLVVTWDESGSWADLNLDHYRLLFEENFDEKALNGPKIFAPVHAPFGAGAFDQPAGPAYDVAAGNLTITAYKRDKKWRSGSVQTADAAQSSGRAPFAGDKGFACGACYFEARMKFPKGVTRGSWAGFWLLSPETGNGHVEIDIVEWYGGDPDGHHQSVHVWPRDRKRHAFQSNYTGLPTVADGDWHTYGAEVRSGTVHIYLDRKEISRVAVPGEFNASYYAVVTLAVLQKEAEFAEAPFSIAVDYIRAYEPAMSESE